MKKYFLLPLILVACNGDIQLEKSMEVLSKKKSDVLSIEKIDLSSETHYLILSDYFKTIASLAYSIKNDERYRNAIGDLSKSNFSCSKVILSPGEWRKLYDQCTSSGHYLCPEELKEYPSVIRFAVKNSPSQLAESFATDSNCAAWL